MLHLIPRSTSPMLLGVVYKNMKIHAHISSPTRASDTEPTYFLVDYFFLTGVKRAETVRLMPSQYGSESQLIHKLKVLLVDYLETKYTPENFSNNDIIFT